jgi:hypothetical protein
VCVCERTPRTPISFAKGCSSHPPQPLSAFPPASNQARAANWAPFHQPPTRHVQLVASDVGRAVGSDVCVAITSGVWTQPRTQAKLKKLEKGVDTETEIGQMGKNTSIQMFSKGARGGGIFNGACMHAATDGASCTCGWEPLSYLGASSCWSWFSYSAWVCFLL